LWRHRQENLSENGNEAKTEVTCSTIPMLFVLLIGVLLITYNRCERGV